MGERLPCTQKVVGSNPATSTISRPLFRGLFFVEKKSNLIIQYIPDNPFCTLNIDVFLNLIGTNYK